MYDWRKMTPEERRDILEARQLEKAACIVPRRRYRGNGFIYRPPVMNIAP